MDNFKISERLKKVASLIKKGTITADVGTDHGYLPIYIAMNDISEKVIAMDVRKKPLEKARDNIKQYGFEDRIELRLSDGLEKLAKEEVDTITICGMGGRLMQRIISDGFNVINDKTQLILSPQSEIDIFRKFLMESSIQIKDEYMIKEDEQFYFIMECNKCPNTSFNPLEKIDTQDYKTVAYLKYSEILLKKKDDNLKEYLLRDLNVAKKVYDKISNIDNGSESVKKRQKEVEFEMKCIEYALSFY